MDVGALLEDDAPPQQFLHNELVVVRQAGRQAVAQFLQNYNCHAILKTSTKVVVFDVRIPIQLAFYALVEHGTLVRGYCSFSPFGVQIFL